MSLKNHNQYKLQKRILVNLLIMLVMGLIFTGCDTIQIPEFLVIKSPTPGSVLVSTQTPILPTEIPEEAIATQSASQNKLILWVPPQFDPAASSEAGRLLQTQLDQFLQDNPGMQIELRVKSLEGSASMLTALEQTLQTAPLAAPSLILVPQNDLQTAVQMNLVHPLPNLDEILSDEDWYDYARQMSQVNNQGFGIPFASDAMIFLYRAENVDTVPISWSEVLSYEMPVLFPAIDPSALFTINLYLSIGGSFYDDQQQLQLELTKLRQVFGFYANGSTSGVFPTWLTQYDTDQMVWQAFQQKTADFAISWASNYLTELPVDVSASPVPSLGAESVTMVSGWLWALSDPVPERHALAKQLAEYLVEQEFLSKWTFQAGLIPVRPSAMDAWENQIIRSLISQITLSAHGLPPQETLLQITPLLESATYDMIMKRATASEAASDVVESLPNP